MLESDTEYMII